MEKTSHFRSIQVLAEIMQRLIEEKTHLDHADRVGTVPLDWPNKYGPAMEIEWAAEWDVIRSKAESTDPDSLTDEALEAFDRMNK